MRALLRRNNFPRAIKRQKICAWPGESLRRGGVEASNAQQQHQSRPGSRSAAWNVVNMHPTRPLHVALHTRTGRRSATIVLTTLEDGVCQLIDDTCRWIQRVHPQPDPVESDGYEIKYDTHWTIEARIAGGWVRDKLLAQESHDFDISLSSLTGHIFALLLRQYLLSNDFVASKLARDPSSPFRHDSDASKELVGHITKIAANPEQSKNLETATATLAGLQLDFVNLRKEAYIGTSRIPVMQFGTALEDAERRDITINALFYNVHTRTVEDLTGMGLDDLHDGLIRTPLDPHRTFLDDPLRVLRCVRFASRFGYEVHESIFACLTGADSAEIRQALMTKVSRERFGMEIDKTMLGPDPSRGVELVERMGLFDIVFGPPPTSLIRNAKATSDTRVVWRAIALIEHIWSCESSAAVQENQRWRTVDQLAGERLLSNKHVRAFLYYSAVLLPLRTAEWQEKKDKWSWAGESVVFDGLKLSSKLREVMATMWRSAALFVRPTTGVFDRQASGEEYRGLQLPFLNVMRSHSISPQATRAMLLRTTLMRRPEIGVSPDALLGANVLWSMIADLSTDDTLWTPCDEENGINLRRQARLDATKVLESPAAKVHYDFVQQLKDENAFERVKEKPLLNGKEVMKATGIPPGNLVALVMSCVEAWQLDLDPNELSKDGDGVERCMSWLHDQWSAGGLVPFERRDELNAKKKTK